MHKPLRIAHFIETGIPGGAEKLLLDICFTLQETGHQPVLLHFDHPYFKQQCMLHGIQQHNVPDRESFKSTRNLWRFALTFKRFLQQHNIDLLHSHLFGPITGAAAGTFLAGIPHVGTLHDIYMIEEKPARIHLLQIAALLKTHLVTVSESMQDFYRQKSFFPHRSLQTIYNGVRIPSTPHLTEAIQLRQQLNIPANDIIITNVGRLVPLKRHDLLLKAAAKLGHDAPYTLLIIGDGPEMHTIQKLIDQHQLQANVILTGHRHDVDRLLRISDIFVQCSDTEGLSMSIIEAMAAGLPCIVTDVGGNHELIKNNENGWRIPASDSDSLTEKLRSLLHNPNERKRMGNTSQILVSSTFSHASCMQAYMKLYQRLTTRT